jgi:L-fucose isomerase-like protein
MRMNPNTVSWELAASLADDPGLFAEIRATVVSDVNMLVDLLNRSRCDANWMSAATRLRNLTASFGMEELREGAEMALSYAPRDPVALRAVNRAAEAFSRAN